MTKLINDYAKEEFFVSPNQLLNFVERKNDKLLLTSYGKDCVEKELISTKDIEIQDLRYENQHLLKEVEKGNSKLLQYKTKISTLECENQQLRNELEKRKGNN